MRTHFILTLIASLAAAGAYTAKAVSTPAEFTTAWNEAGAGTTIELSAGVIDLSAATLTEQEGITLKSADDGESVLLAAPQLVLGGQSRVENVHFSNSAIGAQSVLKVDEATLSGVEITGAGTSSAAVQVAAEGKLTVEGDSVFRNNVTSGAAGAVLVGSEGSLVLSAAEGDEIIFSGNFGSGNNPLDVYLETGAEMEIATASGGSVSFGAGVASASGAAIVKSGAGTVQLGDGTEYAGSLRVSAGTAVLNGTSWRGTGVTVEQNGSLELQTGAQVLASTITSDGTLLISGDSTLGAWGEECEITLSGSLVFTDGATLTALGDLSFDGDTTLSVSGFTTGTDGVGRHLLIDADAFDGDISAISPGIKGERRYSYTLDVTDGDIWLNVELNGRNLTWLGAKKAVWQVENATTLWESEDGQVPYEDGNFVTFENGTVSIVGPVAPGEISICTTKSLTFKTSFNKKTGEYSGAITGETQVTIDAAEKGKVTMNDGNTYTGGTLIKGGTVSAAGAASFGTGEIAVSGGTLDLKSKVIGNDIIVDGTAAVKGGKKYTGEFTLKSGELMKGSDVNVAEAATLAGGTVNGTLSGVGSVAVTGSVELGAAGKITTNGLSISGTLGVGSKGLAMNSKSSVIDIDGGTLSSAGKISACGLSMIGGTLDVTNEKPMAITLKDSFSVEGGAVVSLYGGLTANALEIAGSAFTLAADFTENAKAQTINIKGKGVQNSISGSTVDVAGMMTVTDDLKVEDSSLTLHDVAEAAKPKAQGLTVKGELIVEGTLDGKGLSTTGVLSAAALDADDAFITIAAEKGLAAQSVKLTRAQVSKGVVQENSLTNTQMDVNGAMTVAGNLELNHSTLSLRDYSGKKKAVGLSVKGDLNLTSGSTLSMTGALSAKNLTLGSGSSLTLGGSKMSTIKVGGALDLSGAVTLNLGFTVKEADVGKAFTLFTFKSFAGNLYNLTLGYEGAYTLEFNAKGTGITLVIADAAAWNEYATTVQEAAQTTQTALTLKNEEENDLPVTTAARTVDPVLAGLADTLVQSTWGVAGASRAFAETISSRGAHSTLLEGGKGAAWVSVMGGSCRISSDGGHKGADFTLSGAAIGIEGNVTEKSTIGLAIGNSWGKVSPFSAYRVDQDSTHYGLYGNHALRHNLTLSWMAAHTRTESDGNLAGMNCDWTQDALQLDARLTWARALNEKTVVSAFGGLQYLATDSADFNGLSTGSVQNLRTEIGAGITHKVAPATQVYGELSFIGDVARNNPTATVGDYRTRGANPGRVGMNLHIGAAHQLNDSWSVNAGYSFELQKNATSHGLNVGASYKF